MDLPRCGEWSPQLYGCALYTLSIIVCRYKINCEEVLEIYFKCFPVRRMPRSIFADVEKYAPQKDIL